MSNKNAFQSDPLTPGQRPPTPGQRPPHPWTETPQTETPWTESTPDRDPSSGQRLPLWTDKHLWKHYLRKFAGGNKCMKTLFGLMNDIILNIKQYPLWNCILQHVCIILQLSSLWLQQLFAWNIIKFHEIWSLKNKRNVFIVLFQFYFETEDKIQSSQLWTVNTDDLVRRCQDDWQVLDVWLTEWYTRQWKLHSINYPTYIHYTSTMDPLK